MIQVEEVSHKYNDRYSVEEEEVNETDPDEKYDRTHIFNEIYRFVA